ncbi:MAG: hypothetical protein M1834_004922 [Cirrosporium novae-zelandiae]|nr:MAG: hypothetical protein M1834_004922 [Cirrosporium novae-zelandiae]
MTSPNFYIQSSTATSSTSSLSSDLPFPAPLSRSAFQNPDFTPTSFLSTLSHRHQSLGDLRTDLLTLLQSLQTELRDLLNENYVGFLKLGEELRGGEDLVEGIRVGVLGVRGRVEGVRDVVEKRREEVKGLVEERKSIRNDIQVGRGLVEVEGRVSRLERAVMVAGTQPNTPKEDPESDGDSSSTTTTTSDFNDEESSSSDTETTSDSPTALISTSLLRRHIHSYLLIQQLISRLPPSHPFITKSISPRLKKIRDALLLDLGTALRQARNLPQERGSRRVVRVLGLYGEMGEEGEGVREVGRIEE